MVEVIEVAVHEPTELLPDKNFIRLFAAGRLLAQVHAVDAKVGFHPRWLKAGPVLSHDQPHGAQ